MQKLKWFSITNDNNLYANGKKYRFQLWQKDTGEYANMFVTPINGNLPSRHHRLESIKEAKRFAEKLEQQ